MWSGSPDRAASRATLSIARPRGEAVIDDATMPPQRLLGDDTASDEGGGDSGGERDEGHAAPSSGLALAMKSMSRARDTR
jgi:hypothetical protein